MLSASSLAEMIVPLAVAGAAVAALVAFGPSLLRRPGAVTGALWGGALVIVGGLTAALLVGNPLSDSSAERRALEARAAELTMRAITPGSALACLDAVANFDVEVACEKALFASPEAVAAALAYLDARISLLKAITTLAKRDASYDPPLERMRHAIEVDRFGMSAQVLMTRGCKAATCDDLRLLRNTGPILANMKARTFDSHVTAHASTWNPNGGAMATASLPPLGVGMPTLPAAPTTTGASPVASQGVPVPSKFDFPSAASIPPVSIMNAEPAGPPATEPQPEQSATPTPPRRPQNAPRRQSARETPPPSTAPPPLSVVPPAPPPQTSGAR
jgi:hypothetical protein